MQPATVRLVILAGLSALLTPSAHAQRTLPEDVRGAWAGYSSSSDDGTQGAIIVVARQQNRRFGGEALLPAVQSAPFIIEGTISSDDVFNAGGVTSDGSAALLLHGKTRAMGDGSVRVAALQFDAVSFLDGSEVMGYLALNQAIGGIRWGDMQVPAVQNTWAGRWLSGRRKDLGGEVALGVRAQRGSAFRGAGLFTGGLDLPFTFEGTVGLPAVQDGASQTTLLGADSHGIIAILIGLLLPAVQLPTADLAPAKIDGVYALFGSFADFYRFVFSGRATQFDAGRFSVQAGQ